LVDRRANRREGDRARQLHADRLGSVADPSTRAAAVRALDDHRPARPVGRPVHRSVGLSVGLSVCLSTIRAKTSFHRGRSVVFARIDAGRHDSTRIDAARL